MTHPVLLGLPDEDLLARVLWGEARGEGLTGMHCVANVILNRARHPGWWGSDLRSVLLKPWQFSCLNDNDPNLPKLIRLTVADRAYGAALAMARFAIEGAAFADFTLGADHYHTTAVDPRWADDAKITARQGRHIFYKLRRD